MQYRVDAHLVSAADATVSVRDRGFVYGDAAFETMRAYGGRSLEWDVHVDRLRRTCEAVAIDHGHSDADLRAADEALLTNSTWEIRPLDAVGDIAIGAGPVTDRPVEAFDARVERECYENAEKPASDTDE